MVCHIFYLCSQTQGQGHILESELKYFSSITQKSTIANFIKLQRKVRNHERYAMHHSQRLKVKSFLCITTKATKANLIRLYEKVNNNEMICHNQN